MQSGRLDSLRTSHHTGMIISGCSNIPVLARRHTTTKMDATTFGYDCLCPLREQVIHDGPRCLTSLWSVSHKEVTNGYPHGRLWVIKIWTSYIPSNLFRKESFEKGHQDLQSHITRSSIIARGSETCSIAGWYRLQLKANRLMKSSNKNFIFVSTRKILIRLFIVDHTGYLKRS